MNHISKVVLIYVLTDTTFIWQVNHILYSNRSAAYVKLELFEKALADALKAKELDSSWPKVQCMLYLSTMSSGPLVLQSMSSSREFSGPLDISVCGSYHWLPALISIHTILTVLHSSCHIPVAYRSCMSTAVVFCHITNLVFWVHISVLWVCSLHKRAFLFLKSLDHSMWSLLQNWFFSVAQLKTLFSKSTAWNCLGVLWMNGECATQ